MSTQIKKNGNWVTVAGGTRMWVGTKAALQAALDAGELEDGTAVMVTDDYEKGNEVKSVSIEKATPAGLTTTWLDNVDAAHRAYRTGNQVVMNVVMDVSGTFTGTAGWQKMLELPTSLLEPGESFSLPYMISANDGTDNSLLLNNTGVYRYFENNESIYSRIQSQIILFIV